MSNYPKCPNCGSSNTDLSDNASSKVGWAGIGEFAIGFGAGMLGLGELVEDVDLRGNVDAEFKCNSCGYVWRPDSIYGAVTETWIEQNVDLSGIKGINVHAKFEVHGMQNRQGVCQAFFYSSNKTPLKDLNESYCTQDGSVTTGDYYQAPYEDTIFNDFSLFIPYEEFHLNNSALVLFDVYVSDGNNWIAKSSQNRFNYIHTPKPKILPEPQKENVLNELKKQHNSTMAEEEYLAEYKECIEDGSIGVNERRLLDKLRDKLGISSNRAKELEDSLSPNRLSENEIEYLNEYKTVSNDGYISDKERHLLEKLRKVLNISEQRAKYLENSFPADEKEVLSISKNQSNDDWIPNSNTASPII